MSKFQFMLLVKETLNCDSFTASEFVYRAYQWLSYPSMIDIKGQDIVRAIRQIKQWAKESK